MRQPRVPEPNGRRRLGILSTFFITVALFIFLVVILVTALVLALRLSFTVTVP